MRQPFHAPAAPRRPLRRRTIFVLVGALIASCLAVIVGPSANAAVIDPGAYYQLVARHSGKAIGIADQSTADGAAVQQQTRADRAAQQFQFVDSGSGYHELRARHSGKVVDVSSASTANGANVSQRTDTGGTNQQFRVVDTDGGYVKLINRNSGKALDVWERSTADGARISQYTDTGAANQQWQLVRVDAAPVPKYAGYLFTYFTGENTSAGEQVYFALSQGNDPTRWRQLNSGRPLLTSTVNTRGVRDPFIIRSPQGDKFYQIATDLRMYGNGNWDQVQRTGSKSIVVWESIDLVNWSAPRLARVSPDTAGNTWAPEAYYDEELGKYVVFWASKLYSAGDPNHTGSSYNRMMYATTSDFRTFSAPQVWVDKGYSTIDSTLIKHDSTYYRFTKDERSASQTACGKFILAEKSATILNRTYSFVGECLGNNAISQGEGPLVFKSNTDERWYMFIDEYGGRGYVPFTTTDLNARQWTPVSGYSLPGRPRHGTVLPVTQAEYDRLLQRWG
ncbi:RICIN domain-containing protein [Streptomyces sp. FXY-T5]|uniref:RICIN domain-containing protein n=1 Tax=Streptomyces sp. FXY-T5 TaxID=3064901 RepID=UPI0027D1FE63|nr:RICIN domain-containing protein [Streptomyces sp. FXY-T5]WMD06946.1 RICIN domain-containing protein [Streptomyces sp. FXY-T5]